MNYVNSIKSVLGKHIKSFGKSAVPFNLFVKVLKFCVCYLVV